MRRLARIAAIAAALLIALLGGALFWLFYSNAAPPAKFALDLGEVRRLAASVPGSGPDRIEIEQLSHTMVPRIAIVAGTTWDKIDMVRASYRLVYPDGRTIIIDTANAAGFAKRFGAASYDSGAWQRMVAAMDHAAAIVVTHEHGDHIGGLLESPHRDAAFARAVLTQEQVDDPAGSEPLHWPDLRALNLRPLRYDRLHVLAPGVVLIKAAGHSPGSQMIYVRRADGREYLFMGDTASLLDNVLLQRVRSNYLTTWLRGRQDDRGEVMAQVTALHAALQSNPDLILVPGHDGQQMKTLIGKGLLVSGFGG